MKEFWSDNRYDFRIQLWLEITVVKIGNITQLDVKLWKYEKLNNNICSILKYTNNFFQLNNQATIRFVVTYDFSYFENLINTIFYSW